MCAKHGPKITILEKELVIASPRSFTASSSKWPGLVFGRRCLETFGRRVARDHEMTNIRVRLSRLFQHPYGFRTVARKRKRNPKIFPLKKRKANLNRSLSKRASQP